MGKAFEGLGDWEYVMLAVTMVGVVWLVMKQANIKLNVSQEGYLVQTAGTLGFNQLSTSTTHAGTSGFSVGGMEPPTFHVAPYDPNELTGVNWNVMDDSDPDFVTLADARNVKRDGMNSRGHHAGYGKKPNNVDGMLAGAMMGSSERL